MYYDTKKNKTPVYMGRGREQKTLGKLSTLTVFERKLVLFSEKPSCCFFPWCLVNAIHPRCFGWERSVDNDNIYFYPYCLHLLFKHIFPEKNVRWSVVPMEHSSSVFNVSLQEIFWEIWDWITACAVGKDWACRWRIAFSNFILSGASVLEDVRLLTWVNQVWPLNALEYGDSD